MKGKKMSMLLLIFENMEFTTSISISGTIKQSYIFFKVEKFHLPLQDKVSPYFMTSCTDEWSPNGKSETEADVGTY